MPDIFKIYDDMIKEEAAAKAEALKQAADNTQKKYSPDPEDEAEEITETTTEDTTADAQSEPAANDAQSEATEKEAI